MSKKSANILGIDIGSNSIKIAEFSYPASGKLVLEKFAFKEFDGELKDEELLPQIRTSLKALIDENGFSARRVNLSLTGQSIFIKFAKLPPVSGQEGKIKQIIELEAKQNVPFPINELVWDYQLISGLVDAGSELEAMFVVAKNDFIEQITSIVEDCSMEVNLVDVAPVSCYNAARANQIGGEDCVMLLNIGAKCSTLVFIDSGHFFVRTLPIAGEAITQQVAKEFGIPYKDAEELKRKHGFVALGGAYEEPDSEVAATISKIIRNVMTRLHGEINRSINVYRTQQKGNKPVKIYLAGGSSVMAFTPRFFQDKLKIPCEYFNAFQIVSLSEKIEREKLAEFAHMFSEVIGLGLRKLTTCPIEISLTPQNLKRQHELKEKSPYFYASAASLVVCSMLLFAAIKQQVLRDERLIDLGNEEYGKKEKLQKEIKKIHLELGSLQTSYGKAAKKLDKRNFWPILLNDLQSSLPDNMWLIKISKGTAPDASASEPTTSSSGARPMFPFMRRDTSSATATVQESERLEWLEIKGYFIGATQVELEKFKEKLSKTATFSDKLDDLKTIEFNLAVEGSSISGFKLMLKLKEAITL
jgi:type IV pilus assembly protein PilM